MRVLCILVLYARTEVLVSSISLCNCIRIRAIRVGEGDQGSRRRRRRRQCARRAMHAAPATIMQLSRACLCLHQRPIGSNPVRSARSPHTRTQHTPHTPPMSRSSAGPAPIRQSGTPPPPLTRPAGAVSRAQQRAPPGAMRSGAWNENGGEEGEGSDSFVDEQDTRGRSHATKSTSGNAAAGDEDAIGPLPDRGGPSTARDGRSQSRDSSLARRLSAGLNNVLRGRSGSRERERGTLSRQDTDLSTILSGECAGVRAVEVNARVKSRRISVLGLAR